MLHPCISSLDIRYPAEDRSRLISRLISRFSFYSCAHNNRGHRIGACLWSTVVVLLAGHLGRSPGLAPPQGPRRRRRRRPRARLRHGRLRDDKQWTPGLQERDVATQRCQRRLCGGPGLVRAAPRPSEVHRVRRLMASHPQSLSGTPRTPNTPGTPNTNLAHLGASPGGPRAGQWWR